MAIRRQKRNDRQAAWHPRRCKPAAQLVSSLAYVPRDVVIREGRWVVRATNATTLLTGANVVLKGPPWLPEVAGTRACYDTPEASCETFNEADALHFGRMGWNLVRLGVVWAGAQPTAAAELDAAWLARLHDLLSLCERHGIRVILVSVCASRTRDTAPL